jgi:hypothetical protein
MGGAPAKVKQILERIGDAISQTTGGVRAYIEQHPHFAEIGERMLQEWENGVALSLRSST